MTLSPKVNLVLTLVVAFFIGFIFGNNFDGKGRGEYFHRGGFNKNMIQHKGASSMGDMMKGMTIGLSGKTGDAFDKAFLSEMIMHHEGAVEMANMVLATSKRAELTKLAKDIVTAQTKEIEMMKTWQKAWFGESGTGMMHEGHGGVACTMEAKACPDGSYVGRTGPNCEFAACPGAN